MKSGNRKDERRCTDHLNTKGPVRDTIQPPSKQNNGQMCIHLEQKGVGMEDPKDGHGEEWGQPIHYYLWQRNMNKQLLLT